MSTPDDVGEIVAVAVKALEPYDIPTGSWSEGEKREPAEAVLRAVWDRFGLDTGFELADIFGSTGGAS